MDETARKDFNVYSKAKDMYPLVFMMFEAASDFTWFVTHADASSTIVMRSSNIIGSLGPMHDGCISYNNGSASIIVK